MNIKSVVWFVVFGLVVFVAAALDTFLVRGYSFFSYVVIVLWELLLVGVGFVAAHLWWEFKKDVGKC